MTGLREAGSHGHDAVDVDIGILERKGECSVGQAQKTSTEHFHGVHIWGRELPKSLRDAGTVHTSVFVFGPREIFFYNSISVDSRELSLWGTSIDFVPNINAL